MAPGTLLEIYRIAARIKQVDARLGALIRSGTLRANFYSPRGQEIVSAATSVHLEASDYIVTTYRGLHDQIAKGLSLRALMAEYFGRTTGSCKGKGGAMHITCPEVGIMMTTGIVGSGTAIATGLALASQERGDGRVTVVNFGDGASNIGAVHESLNIAALWRLPLVFLCQNNLFAEHTATENCTAGQIAARAAGYGIQGLRVNGNDAAEMFDAAGQAVRRARQGGGPTLIEAMTFRFNGHNFGDPGNYIPKPTYEAAVAADPMPGLRRKIMDEGVASEDALATIEAAIEAEIDDAVAFAQASPMPEAGEVLTDLYFEPEAA